METIVASRRKTIKERILSALIALPLLILFVCYASDGLFSGFICLVSGVALHEFYGMGLTTQRRAEALLAVAAGVLLTVGMLFGADPVTRQASIVCSLLFVILVYLFRYQDMQNVSRDLAVTILGLMYVPLLLAHAGLLRSLPDGRQWVFLVLVIVMASDTLAYFVGRQWGRHRLYPAVSPNKSIEGSLGGLIGSLLGALLGKALLLPGLSYVDVLLLGVGVGIFSQVGDLAESLLKRSFGVKDSGTLIPGHGGLLDRLDSLLFAFPLTFYYAMWVFQ